jgi:hypothetical protein
MHFTDEDLKEFMETYSAEFHEEISFAEAREMASRVMQLYEMLAELSWHDHMTDHAHGLDETPSPDSS